jgi:hypothetical protein
VDYPLHSRIHLSRLSQETGPPLTPNKLIARQLGMREGTVKVHVRQIMRKFGVTNRTQVAVVCVK